MNTTKSQLLKVIAKNLQVIQKESWTINNISSEFSVDSQTTFENNNWATTMETSKTYKKQ